jgi:hypothetical protein
LSYLIANDYLRQIQDVSLQQVISGNSYFQLTAELAALKELSSYLRQKYDVDSEFSETALYNPAQSYKANNRVYLDAAPYSATATYALNTLALQGGKVYQCTTAIDPGEAFNPAHWELLGNQYDLFYCSYPETLFNIDLFYKVGDKVFYKDHTYEAIQATLIYSHEIKLQYYDTSSIPSSNYFPDDINGRSYWKDLGAYQVAAGTLLSNTDYWTKGDNRHPQLVMFTIDIAVYHLYCRVAPKAIPETRVDRYNAAIAWCRMTAKGDISADIERVQPDRGNRIRFGSQVKNQNNY